MVSNMHTILGNENCYNCSPFCPPLLRSNYPNLARSDEKSDQYIHYHSERSDANKYSGVSNKHTGTLINFQKKCTRYALIRGQYANFLCTNENSLFSTSILT